MQTTMEQGATGITSPASGALLGRVDVASERDIDVALDAGVQAQRAWASTPRHVRYEIMTTFASLVDERSGVLAQLLSAESGKPLAQTQGELGVCCRLFRGFAERMMALKEEAHFLDSQKGLEGDLLLTRREALGLVVAIIPFNFPVELFAHKVAPAIAMGNAVVVKPPVEDPLTIMRLSEMLCEVGLPKEVVQVLYGGRAVGERLVASRLPAAISLTGSTETGLTVAQSAARTLKRVSLELGSNDPLIVLSDADVNLAAEHASLGRQLANGQCCCANKRLLVHRSLASQFTEALIDRFGSLVVGDPSHEDTQIGPLISDTATARVQEQVRATVAAGAVFLTGGDLHDGNYVSPTVLGNIHRDMPIAQDMEIFGPVLPIIVFDEDSEAIDIANSSKYGLSGSVFSQNFSRAMGVAMALETGQVVINSTGLYRPDLVGFGGYKYSGNGREGLETSLDEYSHRKNIAVPGLLN